VNLLNKYTDPALGGQAEFPVLGIEYSLRTWGHLVSILDHLGHFLCLLQNLPESDSLQLKKILYNEGASKMDGI
jgi:hypothetical protein